MVEPADTASATCSSARSGYCDMFDPSQTPLVRHVRLQPDHGYCDMCDPSQLLLERHVRPQQIPLVRHVLSGRSR